MTFSCCRRQEPSLCLLWDLIRKSSPKINHTIFRKSIVPAFWGRLRDLILLRFHMSLVPFILLINVIIEYLLVSWPCTGPWAEENRIKANSCCGWAFESLNKRSEQYKLMTLPSPTNYYSSMLVKNKRKVSVWNVNFLLDNRGVYF